MNNYETEERYFQQRRDALKRRQHSMPKAVFKKRWELLIRHEAAYFLRQEKLHNGEGIR